MSRKGIKNKNSFACEMKAHELGIDPFEILLHFANGDFKALGMPEEVMVLSMGQKGFVPSISADQRINAAKAAMPYLAPKQKSIELKSGEGDKPLEITLNYKV